MRPALSLTSAAVALGLAVFFAAAIMLLYGSWQWQRFALATALFWVVTLTHRPLRRRAAAQAGRWRRAGIVAVVAFDSLISMTGASLALGHFDWWLPALAMGMLAGLLDFRRRKPRPQAEQTAVRSLF